MLVLIWHRLKGGAILLMLFTAIALALGVNMLRVLMLVGLQDPRWLPAPLFLILVCLPLWFGGVLLARRAAAQVKDI
ncbi:MAG: hypothetical protein QM758_00230 [Armatimonas sp.]